MMMTKDDSLKKYIKNITTQMQTWLENDLVHKMVVSISGVESNEILENWTFNIELEGDYDKENENSNKKKEGNKSKNLIHKEIQAIMKQISASVSYLPLIEEQCTFDILIYANKDTEVPRLWEESEAKIIKNSSEVRLRSFSTSVYFFF
jgi:mitotic spindle assembly checkpoint protein MAD2